MTVVPPLWDQMQYQDGKLPIDRLRAGTMTLSEAIAVAALGAMNDAVHARSIGAVAERDHEAHAELLNQAAEALTACREVVELYGLRWAKDSHYYEAALALGIEQKCPRCNGGGIVAPGSECQDCGGNGLLNGGEGA